MSETGSTKNDLRVQRSHVDCVETFDVQFWPVVVGLCTLSAFSAGAMVTLLDGAAKWIGLLVIPIVFFALLLILRFVDNRRIRRSLQLGLVLSLALHLLFVIFASQVDLFHGFFAPDHVAQRTMTARPRVVEISLQREEQPWLDPNEVPTIDPEQPLPEREQPTVTERVPPQPVELEPTPPRPDPQLVKRDSQRETVPMQGQSLSKAQRSETNIKPKSSMKAETARAETASPSASELATAQPTDRAAELARSQAVEIPISRPTERQAEVARGLATAEPTEPSRRQPTTNAPSVDSLPLQAQRRAANVVPQTNSLAEATSVTTPTNSQPASESQRAAPMEISRTAPAPSETRRNQEHRLDVARSRIEQQAAPQRRETANTASVQIAPEVTETRRRALTTAAQPTTPNRVETPRPLSESVANSASTAMPSREVALDRSTAGTAGIGQARNMGREIGSRQSPALTPMQAARRESQQSNSAATEAFTPIQASQTPGRIASAVAPSSTMSADGLPAATVHASPNLQQMSENASAAIESAATSEHRGEISVEKGESNIDTGAPRVVMESQLDRIEGGGQPELNLLRESRTARRGEFAGNPTPALDADVASDSIAAPFAAPSARAADVSSLDAITEMASRDGGSVEFATQRSRLSPESATGDVGGSVADSTLDRREGVASNDLNQQAERLFGSLGDRDDDERESARPLAAIAAQSDSTASASDARGSGVQLDRPTLSGERTSTAGSINLGLENASRTRTQGDVHGEAAELSRRRGDTGQTFNQERALVDNSSDRRMESERGPAPNILADAPSEMGKFSSESPAQGADPTAQLDREMTATKQSEAGMALEIDAPLGAAGLGDRYHPDAGIESRRSSNQSPDLLPDTDTRFIRQEVGGTPTVNRNAIVAQQPFRGRTQSARVAEAPYTEEAIELGLAFLARYQQPDGSWVLGQFDIDHPERGLQYNSDSAATGLALLAFQGAGYNHLEFKYADQVDGGIRWLISNQKPSGELFVESDQASNSVCRFYSHGIAALALAEAYGMTQDPEIKQAAQNAIDFIERTQHAKLGGWRYSPGINSDTSVTGWMVMALQSARLAGLDVKPETLDNVTTWLDFARDTDAEHKFRYRPDAVSDQQYDRSLSRISNPSMTSVGLLMQLYLGWNRNDQRLIRGAEYLLQHLPSDATEAQRDTYYWYYATQVMRHVGGERWERWNARLHPMLVQTQIRQGDLAGSWHPYEPVPDSWGRKGGGRLYVTTMNLLSLEVDYRLLPLYDETAK